jgi:membrane fusion protein (multidrug efflux system)
MKTWVFLIVAVVVLGAAAYGVRQSGIDVVELAGFKQKTAEGTAKPDGGTKQQAGQGKGQQGKGQGGKNRGPSAVETAKATTQELSDDVTAIGNLLAEESVAIAPETSGRVAEILFKDGDTVKAGDPLFRLDTDLAEADLAEAKARLKLAESNYARNQTLRKSGNIAQSTYDASFTEREVARTAVESAQVRLAKLTITAPFPGTLGFRTISTGAYVNAGTTLVQLDKIDILRASFSVPELEQARIRLGQTVELTADAVPGETFTATITAIDPSVDVNGRALKVRARLDNSALKLRPGLLVRIAVKGKPRNAVLVPESAIVQRGDGVFVYLARAQKAEETRVVLGRRMSGTIEIVKGVDAGEEVIVAGNTRLSNGADIEVVAPATTAQ